MDILIQPARIQSPTSIAVYNHCARKYYYQYIRKLETLPNIYKLRGGIAHEVLEQFFDSDVSKIGWENYRDGLRLIVQNLLVINWNSHLIELAQLDLGREKEMLFFEETLLMLFNWLESFFDKVTKLSRLTFPEAFKSLVPEREKEYISFNLYVRGIIDAVENHQGEIRIMDYKTSSVFDVEEHRLQLAIYTLLYHEKHDRLPDKAGVYFLQGGEEYIKVDQELLVQAKQEIEKIHKMTQSKEKKDYPKNLGYWCKRCDFYSTCFGED